MRGIVRGTFALAVLYLGFIAAVAAHLDAQAKDAADLKGVWVADSLQRGGKLAPPKMAEGVRMTFSDGSLLIAGYFGPEEEKAAFTTDRSVTPNHIDLVGPGGEKVPGIFEVRDGKLTMALPPSGSVERPKSLASPEGSTVLLFVMRRPK